MNPSGNEVNVRNGYSSNSGLPPPSPRLVDILEFILVGASVLKPVCEAGWKFMADTVIAQLRSELN